MDSSPVGGEMRKEELRHKIDKLEQKIDVTKYNMEVSKEIIVETPANAQREKLIQKNIQRQHGIAGIEKEIRDIEQRLEE
ncbi:MAG: small, acid-soluble spore protein tlp [Candidatus Fimivivens sp.]|nr:small, acid-soluble spore protein tlp [Candidatus Fimivivens sp.]